MYLVDMSNRNQTESVILGLLSVEGNQSGYDLRKTIQGSVGFFWGESFGQIYPTLKRMAGEGLIVANGGASSDGEGGRQRQLYSLTEAGRARLTEWLAKPYRDDPPRDEFLLKLFFGGVVAPSVSTEHVRAFREKNLRLLATLEELGRLGRERNGDHPQFAFWMLTLTAGVAQVRAGLEWSEAALAMLAELEKGRQASE